MFLRWIQLLSAGLDRFTNQLMLMKLTLEIIHNLSGQKAKKLAGITSTRR